MRHVPDGVLRRFVDEPSTVPDAFVEHLEGCERCQAQRHRMAEDAREAHRLLLRPLALPDVDRAWERFEKPGATSPRRVPRRIGRRRVVGTTGVVVGSGVAVVALAAAATLSVVFSPTHVAPLPVTKSDLQALTNVLGFNGGGLLGSSSRAVTGRGTAHGAGPAGSGSTSPTSSSSGTRAWAYGTIRLGARPKPTRTSSLQAAESAAGMSLALPSSLPAGVSGPPEFMTESGTSVTVTFDDRAGSQLAGSTLTLTIGPGLLAEYGGDIGTGSNTSGSGGTLNVPTLVVGAAQRPTATSTGATTSQLESFVLSRPGFPQQLAHEIQLLGNPRSVLPIPVPSNVGESSTSVNGSPAVALSVAGGAATDVVWEDQNGIVRTVGGLITQSDALDVARQLG